jgi:hypothetical protein
VVLQRVGWALGGRPTSIRCKTHCLLYVARRLGFARNVRDKMNSGAPDTDQRKAAVKAHEPLGSTECGAFFHYV